MNKGAGATSIRGSIADKKECVDELDWIATKFIKTWISVMVGGAIDKSKTEARATHAQFYANAVRKRGM
jgi:hypothetical protein